MQTAAQRYLITVRDQCTCLFLVVLVVYAATASYAHQSVDTASMYHPAWQFAHHGNITMNEFAHKPLWWVHTEDRVVSGRFPGASWFATPFYLLDRGTQPTAGMGNLAAAVAAAGAVTVFFLLARRLASTGTAAGASLVLAFATPTWSVSGDALWTHGPGQLWLLLGVLLTARGAYLRAGLALGAAVLTRPHYGVVAVVMGVYDLLTHRRLKPMLAIGVGTAVGTLLLVIYNKHVFDVTDVRAGYQTTLEQATSLATSSSYLDNLSGLLLSPSRGVLILTPFLLMLLPGLRSAWTAAPDWARSAALAGTAYMLLQSALNGFSGGYAFYSYRLAIEWLTLASPLLLLSYTTWVRSHVWRQRLFGVLVTFSVASYSAASVAYVPEAAEPDHWATWATGEVFAERPVLAVFAAAAGLLGAGLAARLMRTPTRPTP